MYYIRIFISKFLWRYHNPNEKLFSSLDHSIPISTEEQQHQIPT